LLEFQLMFFQQHLPGMKCCSVLLLCAHAVALRAPAAKNVSQSVMAVESNTTDSDNSAKINDVMDSVAAMMSKMNEEPKKHHVAQANVSSGGSSGAHQKVDVGFTEFEKQLNQTLESGVKNATQDGQWTAEMRQQLLTNVTDSMMLSFKEKVKPIKQNIGKTWMALPDDQKDEYVSQLKARFESDWSGGMSGIESHLKIGLRRVGDFTKQTIKLSPDKILAGSEKTLADSLVNPRCYGSDDDSFLQLDNSTTPTKPALQDKGKPHKLKKFCMPPAVDTVVGRFKDSEGMMSMSFRFEAGAMSLVQTGVKERAREVGH